MRAPELSCEDPNTEIEPMTAKKLMLAGALALGATLGLATTGWAQSFYGGYGGQYYDEWNGPGPGYYNYGPSEPDIYRGGPGPRVQAGSGMGIGAVR
jgi:hypothetical protein